MSEPVLRALRVFVRKGSTRTLIRECWKGRHESVIHAKLEIADAMPSFVTVKFKMAPLKRPVESTYFGATPMKAAANALWAVKHYSNYGS